MAEKQNDAWGAEHTPTHDPQPLPTSAAIDDTERSPTPQCGDVATQGDSKSCEIGPKDHADASRGEIEESAPKRLDSIRGQDEAAAGAEKTTVKQPEATLNPMNQERPVNPEYHETMKPLQPLLGGFLPMPPLPVGYPKMTFTPAPGQDPNPSWIAALEHNMSVLGETSLYKAFQVRRERNSDFIGPRLLKAVAEYMGDTDERLKSLHRSLRSSPAHAGMQGTVSDHAQGTINRKALLADTFDKVLMEMRFYHCGDGFDFTSGITTAPNRRIVDPNHYTSISDPAYFIRALFQWKEAASSSGQTLDTGSIPESKDIDILTLIVSSRPLSVFFEKRLGLKTTNLPILKFGKPFRSLICNYSQLSEQLQSLMAKHGSTMAENSETDFQEPSRGHQPLSQQSLSTEDANSDEDQPEIFDQQPALEHFRLLVRFIDRYLEEKVALFDAFQGGEGERVAFEDLWMLFSNRKKIICPLRENRITVHSSDSDSDSGTDDDDDNGHLTRRRYVPQAYRVMASFGGAPLQSSLEPKTVDVSGDRLKDDPFFRLFLGPRSAFRAQTNTPGLQRAKERFSSLQLVCMYIDFDGVNYGLDTEVFVFKPFDGQVLIKSLEAYPLEYFVNPCEDYLMQRGQKFIDVTASPRYMDHTGMTIGETREECNSPVVVDLKLAFTEYQKDFPPDDSIIPKFKSLTKNWPSVEPEIPDFFVRVAPDTFCQHGHYCYTMMCGVDRYIESQKLHLDKLQPRIQELLEEFESMPRDEGSIDHLKKYMKSQDLLELLPGSVPGFSLRNRAWVQLNLDQLSFVERQDDWNKLALPKGHREIVQAMVETHSMGSRGYEPDDATGSLEMDLVRGKGKGCIILLHGVPGVGKTSTAECVASYTKRPLYSITCGDVGYEPEDVERHMGKHFKLAHRWRCVLLLDEADVFLAKRDKTDVKRNGLVSSFLRILEYYSGILFLTTNRVGAIDDAFRSRLHLTLYYPKLTQAQTLKIWRTNIQRLKENNKLRLDGGRVPIKFNDEKIIDWVKKNWRKFQWNGRQIRNAFQTAAALAEFKAKNSNAERNESSRKTSPRLTVEHFKLLARASTQFSEYLRETHGDDEDERAILDKLRARPTRKKVQKTAFSDEDDEDEDEEDEEDEDYDHGHDDGLSDGESGSESSGASGSGGSSDSATESTAGGKNPKKKGKQKEGGRSRSSKKDKKGKGRKDR